jgi:hypothetical protein
MKANVGTIDKGLRIGAGLVLLGFAFLSEHPLHLWGVIGVVPLLTGLFGYCPLYGLLGLNTCPLKKAA